MHEGLVGEEVLLDLPCGPGVPALMSGFVEELVSVGGGETENLEGFAAELGAAIESLCASSSLDSEGRCRLVARLLIGTDGLEVRLTCQQSDLGELRIDVREA
ncbi:MAG: hypothetical protein ACE5HV_04935 [Acidobacteriota bacterium]